MDGEHAFSASLTLVMVNVAFPYNEKDATAMETALSVLQGMAAKGNEYVEARLTLLTNLRASIGPHLSTRNQTMPANVPMSQFRESVPYTSTAIPMNTSIQPPDNILQYDSSFQLLQDVSFDFDTEEDPKFWEELTGNLDIDMNMDTGWIENALRNETYHQNNPGL